MSELTDTFLTLVLVRVWPVNVSSCEPSERSAILSPAATAERRDKREGDETDRDGAQTHAGDVEMRWERVEEAGLCCPCAGPGWLWNLLEAFHTPFLLL